MRTLKRTLLVAIAASLVTLLAAQVQPTGTFERTGNMNWSRSSHTETLLLNGKVLIAGGLGGVPGNPGGLALQSAEIYDPATGVFSPTGDMTEARHSHTATLLQNGTVLIAGGYPAFASAEIYDPLTGTFAATGSMVVLRGYFDVFGFSSRRAGRTAHTATLLADGRVLLTGGGSPTGVASNIALDAETYDPSTGSFSPTGGTNCVVNPGGFSECGMTVRRAFHTATRLDDGTVLIVGGANTSAEAGAEVFYPSTGSFGSVATMTTPRSSHTATLLPNGDVLVAGGQDAAPLGTAEVYRWATGSFSALVPMQSPRVWHTATALASGKILLVGGYTGSGYLADSEVFDPVAGAFAPAGAVMEFPRADHKATLLGTGAVLVTGGGGDPDSPWSAELFLPSPVASDGTLSVVEDTVAQGILIAAAPSGSTYSIVSNGSLGTATLTDASTGAFTFTPFPDANGSDTFTFKVTSGSVDSNVGTIAVTIEPQNDAPLAVDASATTDEDIPLSAALQGSDVDGDALTWTIVSNGTLGTAVVTDVATGAFDYTPNAGATGIDSFTFKANDGTLDSNAATYTVTITAVNDAPVASDGVLTTPEDTATSGTLSATDADSAALTFSIVTNGAKGTAAVTDPTTGAYTYTPQANASGTDTFTFKANDGALDSNTATVTVTITAVNDAPVASDGVLTTAEDTAASGTLSASDTDSAALTFSIVTNGTKGTAAVTDPTTGAYTYTPQANAMGTDTFTFKANDGALDGNTATVTVTITAVNDPPVAVNGTLSTTANTSASGTLGGSDIDSPSLTFSIVANGTLGTATITDAATGAFTYTPNLDTTGNDAFTFKVSDGALDSNIASVAVSIGPGPGGTPAVSLSSASLSFNNQQVGTTSSVKTVTLQNTGTASLVIAGITITGANAADFSLSAVPNACGGSIAPGLTCAIGATFTPTNTGTRTAAVSIAHNAAGSPHTINLTGSGKNDNLTMSPTALDFGVVVVGTADSARQVTINNTRSQAVTLRSISTSGDFAVVSTTCPTSLAGRTSCLVNVAFAPTGQGVRTGALTVTSSGVVLTTALSGSGTIAALSPTVLNFGRVAVGASSPLGTQLRNVMPNVPGSLRLIVSSIAITGGDGRFRVTAAQGSCGLAGGDLGPQEACLVTVTFSPLKKGKSSTGLLTFTLQGEAPRTVQLTGSGM